MVEQQVTALLTQLTAQNQALAQALQQQDQHNGRMFQKLTNALGAMQARSTGVVYVR